jgi:hypothetical protein
VVAEEVVVMDLLVVLASQVTEELLPVAVRSRLSASLMAVPEVSLVTASEVSVVVVDPMVVVREAVDLVEDIPEVERLTTLALMAVVVVRTIQEPTNQIRTALVPVPDF